jgi:hypothetical protein
LVLVSGPCRSAPTSTAVCLLVRHLELGNVVSDLAAFVEQIENLARRPPHRVSNTTRSHHSHQLSAHWAHDAEAQMARATNSRLQQNVGLHHRTPAPTRIERPNTPRERAVTGDLSRAEWPIQSTRARKSTIPLALVAVTTACVCRRWTRACPMTIGAQPCWRE